MHFQTDNRIWLIRDSSSPSGSFSKATCDTQRLVQEAQLPRSSRDRVLTKSEVWCSACSNSITVEMYSAGFSDVIAFTCDNDSTVLMVSIYDKMIGSILGTYPGRAWTESEKNKVETQLIPCPCGGTFKRNALPKCPKCNAPLIGVPLAPSEFIVVG